MRRVLIAIVMLVLMPCAAVAQGEQWQVGSMPSFSTGRYGGDTATEVLHTPITARRLFADGDLTLVFPFTCIWGSGDVTLVSGAPVRTQTPTTSTRTDATATRGGSTDTSTRPGPRPDATRPTAAPATTPVADAGSSTVARVSACGLGDIVVRGRYYVLDERGWLPTIAVRAHLKTPTASEERGLGTGRPDEGVGVEISRTIAGGLMAMVDGGYTNIGTPDGVVFNDTWWYDVGLGQDLARGAVNVSVFFEAYRAIVPGLVDARDVLAAVTVKGAGGWRVQMAGQFGLSESAPDRGFALGASRRF